MEECQLDKIILGGLIGLQNIRISLFLLEIGTGIEVKPSTLCDFMRT